MKKLIIGFWAISISSMCIAQAPNCNDLVSSVKEELKSADSLFEKYKNYSFTIVDSISSAFGQSIIQVFEARRSQLRQSCYQNERDYLNTEFKNLSSEIDRIVDEANKDFIIKE